MGVDADEFVVDSAKDRDEVLKLLAVVTLPSALGSDPVEIDVAGKINAAGQATADLVDRPAAVEIDEGRPIRFGLKG